jgi:hypothetical protein
MSKKKEKTKEMLVNEVPELIKYLLMHSGIHESFIDHTIDFFYNESITTYQLFFTNLVELTKH